LTDHLTDEQQVELLKNFWHEYGLSIILGITLALCAGFGFKYYQSYVTQRSYQASVVYERFVVGLMNGEINFKSS
jgi:predicted negative regulator of RcsB-dependent stress response